MYSKLSADVSRRGRVPCYDVIVRYTVGTGCINVLDIMLVRWEDAQLWNQHNEQTCMSSWATPSCHAFATSMLQTTP